MKKLFLISFFCFFVILIPCNAIPAKPGLIRTLTLQDGTTIKAQLVGDEHGHYWLAENGAAYQQVEGSDVFHQINAEEAIAKSKVRRAQANAQFAKRLSPQKVGEVGNYIGQKKGIIILVNFSNVSWSNTASYFNRVVNEANFSDGNFVGSMYDYFYAQSDGQFQLTFDVVGPVTVSNTQSYYGSNDSSGNDKYPATMVGEALKLANQYVNYADYDWDGDGEVDQVYVVYAGKGEADGGAANTIWPHAWTLSSARYYGDGSGALTLDGVRIDSYACGGELNGSTGNLAGIGTMCHEFSHCLGYPDYYDTDYSGGQGMGYWDLMDSGSYNDDGYRPAGYTTHERWEAGWRQPIELTATTQVSNMKSLVDSDAKSYIIYNQGNRNEYYILENRQQEGWDAGIPGEGLLIVHVDYNASAWNNNTPNDQPSHQRMTWIPADNQYQYTTYNGTKYYSFSGMANDPFPYGEVNAFNKSTTPAAKFFNKNSDGTYYLDSSIEEITQNSDGTVSFSFKGINNVATPTFSPKAGRYAEAQTVTISCDTEGCEIYYTKDGTTPTASSTHYTAPIIVEATTTLKAIAIADDAESNVATAKYVIGAASTTKNFKRVASVDELVSGMRYIIACGSKKVAAGDLNNTFLSPVDVTLSNDIITITDDVAVFEIEGSGGTYSFMNEETGEYLYSTEAKKVYYSSDEKKWTLANGTNGVEMTYGDSGTMTYNVNDPRFNVYTSNATASMIRANLYMGYDGEVPIEKQDVTIAFSTTTATATLGQPFTPPTLTTTPANLVVTYTSSDEAVANVDVTTGAVTLVEKGTTTITATFAGNDYYNPGSASYILNVQKPSAVANRYELVTDASTLVAGDSILIVCNDTSYKKILSTKQNANNRGAVEFASINEDNTITPVNGSAVILLGQEDGKWTFYVTNGETQGYLYAASRSNNYLRTEQKVDANAKATISIESGGNATIKFSGTNTRNTIFYNSQNTLFSCYSSSATQKKVQIYRQVKVKIEDLLGDVNNDGAVTVADVTALVNILLGQDANQTLYNHEAADVDGQYGVTTDDITALINLVLKQ